MNNYKIEFIMRNVVNPEDNSKIRDNIFELQEIGENIVAIANTRNIRVWVEIFLIINGEEVQKLGDYNNLPREIIEEYYFSNTDDWAEEYKIHETIFEKTLDDITSDDIEYIVKI